MLFLSWPLWETEIFELSDSVHLIMWQWSRWQCSVATDYQSDLYNTAISTHKVAGLNIDLYYSPRHNNVRHTYSLNITRALTLNLILYYGINDKHRCDIGASPGFTHIKVSIFTEGNMAPFNLPIDGELFLHLRGDFDSNSSQVVNLGILFLWEVTKQLAIKNK